MALPSTIFHPETYLVEREVYDFAYGLQQSRSGAGCCRLGSHARSVSVNPFSLLPRSSGLPSAAGMIITLLLLLLPPLLLLLRRAGHLSSTAHIQQRGPDGVKRTPRSAPFCSSDVRGRRASAADTAWTQFGDGTDMEFNLRETTPCGENRFQNPVKRNTAVLRLRGGFGRGPSEGGELSWQKQKCISDV